MCIKLMLLPSYYQTLSPFTRDLFFAVIMSNHEKHRCVRPIFHKFLHTYPIFIDIAPCASAHNQYYLWVCINVGSQLGFLALTATAEFGLYFAI